MRNLALAVLFTVLYSSVGTCQQSNFQAIDDDPNTLACLVNKARAENCLKPLGLDSDLSQVALGHSEDMSSMKNMSHVGSNGRRIDYRLNQSPWNGRWTIAGENIAVGYTDPVALVRGWLNSTEHRENLLNGSFTQSGYGYSSDGNYWTQVLVQENDDTPIVYPVCSNVAEMSEAYIDTSEIRQRFTTASYCDSNTSDNASSVNSAGVNAASTESSSDGSSNEVSANSVDDSSSSALTAASTGASVPQASTGSGGKVYAWAYPVRQADGSYKYVYNRDQTYDSISEAESANSQAASKDGLSTPVSASALDSDKEDYISQSSLDVNSPSTPDPNKLYMVAMPVQQADGSIVYQIDRSLGPVRGSQAQQLKAYKLTN